MKIGQFSATWALAVSVAAGGSGFHVPGPNLMVEERASLRAQNAQRAWSISPQGDRSFRFEARPGDVWIGDSRNDRVRTELQLPRRMDFNKDIWVDYFLRVKASPRILSDSLVVGQFHASEDRGDFSGYPALELNLERDGLHIYTASVTEKIRGSAYPRVQRGLVVNADFRRARHIQMRVKFSYEGTGALDVWLDGRRISCWRNVNIGMNDDRGPYFKFGLYWRPQTTPQKITAYYDKLYVGFEPSEALQPLASQSVGACPRG